MKKANSETPRDNTWLDYHRKMGDKYALFVRFMDKRKPYYTNASLDEVMTHEDVGYVEIGNCARDPDDWDEQPHMWRIINEIGNYPRTVTEVFHDETGDEIGYLRNGSEWWLKIFRADSVYFMRDVASGYSTGQSGRLAYTRLTDGSWRVGTQTFQAEVNGAPQDVLYGIIRRLNAQHRRGFYEDDIEWLIEVGGLNRTQI